MPCSTCPALWLSEVEPGSTHDLTAARELRCLAERAFALLVGRWRALRHITTSPPKIGRVVQAALVPTSNTAD